MVDIVKPDISSVWAEAGAVIAPSNEKIKLGWTSEVPPHQYENFVQNRQDEMLAYLNQKGVPEWRTGTEYFLGKSFVQDAGKIYKANKNSGGLLPNQKPSTDATNEYWEQATFSLSDLKQTTGTSTKDVMSQKATSDAIALKVDSTRVKQVTGVSTTDIMSQKAVTDALGAILPTPVVQSSGSSTTDVMSQKASTDNFGQPSITGSCTTNGTTDNTVQLTDIVTTLGLEVGDVIRIQYSGYDKLHSVESITDDNSIIVNYEHAGNRGNGSLRLPDVTENVTIARIAKWYNAPLGLGQAWVMLSGFRVAGTNYDNTTGRALYLSVTSRDSAGNNCGVTFRVDGTMVSTCELNASASQSPSVNSLCVIPNDSTYEITLQGGDQLRLWGELR